MSFWVYLKDNNVVVSVDPHEEGGTFCMGGCGEAELNITYNYSPHYYKELNKEKGLRWLDGKKAKECIPAIERAVYALGVERDGDYWKPTAGNAGYALAILLRWARVNPDAVFDVD